jgi:hypothetical protein
MTEQPEQPITTVLREDVPDEIDQQVDRSKLLLGLVKPRSMTAAVMRAVAEVLDSAAETSDEHWGVLSPDSDLLYIPVMINDDLQGLAIKAPGKSAVVFVSALRMARNFDLKCLTFWLADVATEYFPGMVTMVDLEIPATHSLLGGVRSARSAAPPTTTTTPVPR